MICRLFTLLRRNVAASRRYQSRRSRFRFATAIWVPMSERDSHRHAINHEEEELT